MRNPFAARFAPISLMMQAVHSSRERLSGIVDVVETDMSKIPDPSQISAAYLEAQLEVQVAPGQARSSILMTDSNRRSSLSHLMVAVGRAPELSAYCGGGLTSLFNEMILEEAKRHAWTATITIAVIKRAISGKGASPISLNKLSQTRVSDINFWRMAAGLNRPTHPVQILGAFAHYDAEIAAGCPLYQANFMPLVESIRAQATAA